jgi:uncharacterized protein (TIRG00374 family)
LKQLYQKYKYWLKWIFSIALLIVVFYNVDASKVINNFKLVPWWYYPTSFLIAMLLLVIATIRWRFFLPEKPFSELFKLNLIGIYYAFILPSSVTGDVAKVVQIKEPTNGKTYVAAGLIIDRLIGFLSMTLLLIPSILFCKLAIFYPFLNYVIALAIFLMILLFLLYKKIASTIFNVLINLLKIKSKKINALLSTFTKLIISTETVMKENKKLSYVFIVAILFQFINAASFLVTDVVFNFNLSFWHYALFACIMQVIVLLPLSIGGIGLKDISLVTLLGLSGITNEKALSVSLVGYIIIILTCLVGLVVNINYQKNV